MAASPRVVYVCQTFPWVTQTFTVREVTLLREQGLDVRVFSFKRPPDGLIDDASQALLPWTTFLPPPGSVAFVGTVLRGLAYRPLTLVRLAVEALAGRGLARTTWRMRARAALAVARGTWIAEQRSGAELFHAEFPDEAAAAAMTAALLSGVGFSFKSHASFNPQQLARKAARARFVATESAFTRRRYFADLPDGRVLVNRGGVRPESVRESSPPAAGELRILCVGTLQEKKGHRVLVEALEVLRERHVPFRCLIVGSGPLEPELRASVAAAGLDDQVILEPYRKHEDVERLYLEHDVHVLPCVVTADGDQDGIPAVLIEAAAAGCLPVSTPVGGIPELIEDGASGVLVPERDAAALADALARLAADPGLRNRLAAGARAVVRERFDLVRNVGELAERFRRESS